jgi:hypothetical protein
MEQPCGNKQYNEFTLKKYVYRIKKRFQKFSLNCIQFNTTIKQTNPHPSYMALPSQRTTNEYMSNPKQS